MTEWWCISTAHKVKIAVNLNFTMPSSPNKKMIKSNASIGQPPVLCFAYFNSSNASNGSVSIRIKRIAFEWGKVQRIARQVEPLFTVFSIAFKCEEKFRRLFTARPPSIHTDVEANAHRKQKRNAAHVHGTIVQYESESECETGVIILFISQFVWPALRFSFHSMSGFPFVRRSKRSHSYGKCVAIPSDGQGG